MDRHHAPIGHLTNTQQPTDGVTEDHQSNGNTAGQIDGLDPGRQCRQLWPLRKPDHGNSLAVWLSSVRCPSIAEYAKSVAVRTAPTRQERESAQRLHTVALELCSAHGMM